MGGCENHLDKRTSIFFPRKLIGRSLWKRIIKRGLVEITGGYNKTFGLFRRKSPDNINFYSGSSWICLSGETLKWMESYLISHSGYTNYFQNVLCPDESFFQTLLLNSPYKDKREDYLSYVDWTGCKNSPRILNTDDFEKLCKSEKLMARKFDTSIDREIINKLKKKIGQND